MATRQSLLQAALELVADRGEPGATTGAIEARAGLSPRAGGMYRHFASKGDLIREALKERIAAVKQLRDALPEFELPDLRSELTILARVVLAELDMQRELTLVLEQQRTTYPELIAALRDELVEPAFKRGADYLVDRLGVEERKAAALSCLYLGALVNYRRHTWTLGSVPAEVAEDEFVATWVDQLALAARRSTKKTARTRSSK